MSILDIDIKYGDEIFTCIKDLLQSEGITIIDTKVSLIVDNAYNAICKYLGVSSETFNNEYFTATVQLSIVYYNLPTGFDKVTSKTQGARSQTISTTYSSIDSDGLTQQVKSMLPLPRLKVL